MATNASKIANDIIRKELAYIREQGTYKDELVITSKQVFCYIIIISYIYL